MGVVGVVVVVGRVGVGVGVGDSDGGRGVEGKVVREVLLSATCVGDGVPAATVPALEGAAGTEAAKVQSVECGAPVRAEVVKVPQVVNEAVGLEAVAFVASAMNASTSHFAAA
jgi:hypothetical protein